MNFKELEKLSKRKTISYVRQMFFNILSNNSIFREYMQSNIPSSSKIAKNLEKLCELAGDEKLENCKFVLSRNEFGKGVKSKMESHTGTKGINLESGQTYTPWAPLEAVVGEGLNGGKHILGFMEKAE